MLKEHTNTHTNTHKCDFTSLITTKKAKIMKYQVSDLKSYFSKHTMLKSLYVIKLPSPLEKAKNKKKVFLILFLLPIQNYFITS